jgi:hypothetical protein
MDRCHPIANRQFTAGVASPAVATGYSTNRPDSLGTSSTVSPKADRVPDFGLGRRFRIGRPRRHQLRFCGDMRQASKVIAAVSIRRVWFRRRAAEILRRPPRPLPNRLQCGNRNDRAEGVAPAFSGDECQSWADHPVMLAWTPPSRSTLIRTGRVRWSARITHFHQSAGF